MAADLESANVVIRPLVSLADYRACVQLQREIWGDAFEVVPAAILQVSAHVGGLTLGAFDKAGQLIGFVFGLTGLDDGRAMHWSHMLGVRPTLRNAGIGRLLKEYQHQELERQRVAGMHWSYDPLIAKNAHFNLNVLGARAVRFVPDMYGDTASPLHHGLATDRLVVEWDSSRPARHGSLTLDGTEGQTPVMTPHPRPGDPDLPPEGDRPTRVRIEIPTDFAQLLIDSPADSRVWHTAAREHFQRAFARGYEVTGFRRDSVTGRSFYLLALVPSTP